MSGLICFARSPVRPSALESRLVRADVRNRIDRDGDDLVWRVVRDLLDVHAAFGRGDDRNARRLAVDQHREIELLLDRGALLDVDAIDLLSHRAGLKCDEG
jgi:hypothetical protein